MELYIQYIIRMILKNDSLQESTSGTIEAEAKGH
jgi:hypothetical protein